MPVSRNESKRKRRTGDPIVNCVPDTSKRTKVHAQRKFAQGAALMPPAIITQFKEIEKEKPKTTETVSTELLPTKRPNTEDFLTFLCFRGTSILPPSLDFFNAASSSELTNAEENNEPVEKATVSAPSSVVTSPNQPPDRPFVAFGVRKRADPYIYNQMDRKRRHAHTIQALRRKYQDQRLAKIRAIAVSKINSGDSTSYAKTRAAIKRQIKPTITKIAKKKPCLTASKRPVLVKRTMRLRSGGVVNQKINVKVKNVNKPTVSKKTKPVAYQQKQIAESSSEYSSDDDQPLVKTVKNLRKPPKPVNIKKTPTFVANRIVSRHKLENRRTVGPPKRCTRSNSSVEPAQQSQRPSRKTKEAAALYMELLGRKLVQEAEVDEDTMSIDSFPELPNVKRAEQRENEIKAKSSKNSPRILPRKSIETKTKPKITEKPPKPKVNTEIKIPPKTMTIDVRKTRQTTYIQNTSKDKPEQKVKANKTVLHQKIVRETRQRHLPILKTKRLAPTLNAKKLSVQNARRKPTLVKTEVSLRNRPNTVIKPALNEPRTRKRVSVPSKEIPKKLPTTSSPIPKEVKISDEHNFSDSDEEPLASKIKNETTATTTINTASDSITKPKIDEKETPVKVLPIVTEVPIVKSEKEGVKKNEILDISFSLSDDDDEKAFRGFMATDSKPRSDILAGCSSNQTDLDLLCKDISRRFGKGKVNMSNEQIEKWLNDADQELKKESIEKGNDKSVFSQPCDTKSVFTETKIATQVSAETITYPDHKTANRNLQILPEKRSIFQQRRPIINKTKERKDKIPNFSAFSPDNESSVYAFEADSELPVSTPFRRHCRRPSSTATSKSEDEVSKITSEDDSRKSPIKFRVPSVFKHDDIKNNSASQQLSLTLGSDDSSNQCASIAVQVDLSGNLNEQVEPDGTQNEIDVGEGHLFYIPLQTGTQSALDQQVIQGVAVKLGTAGPNGPNQRVIMQAKLVTKPTNSPAVFANKSILSPQPRNLTSMYPPVGTVQPFRSKPSEIVKPLPKIEIRPIGDHSHSSDDIKLDRCKQLPTSPSTSSSSSARLNKRTIKVKPRGLETTPTISNNFPNPSDPAQIVEAPTFHPTDKEFQDPLEYIDKIRPLAESFGLCRIVPPAGFKPECKVSDDMRFTAYNQYVHKMLHRWGPNFRELTAIKKYLATQNIVLAQAPWIGGMEVDLPRLYQTVQSLGGLKEVIEKKRWPRVAEVMRIPKSAQERITKLDDIYCKYLLPYDTLSPEERQKLLNEVDTDWERHQAKFATQSGNTASNTDESEAESDDGEDAECIVRGRSMPLNAFYRIARNTMSMWFKTNEPAVNEVEAEFWKHVNLRTNHLCVHCGSIDSGGYGYGFVCTKFSPFARHPWNLKVLTNNTGSLLRSMGPIMGVTVPTLHVGMVFSACCWYRDPHGLPWIEYLHTGANKVWYGIPDSLNASFRQTLNKIVPNLCRKTSVWLPSDTAMIPPSLLVANNVSLCRTVQEPGQYIVIFPKAFTSSLCTGYTVSESVFFAQTSWLDNSSQIFSELKESSEPAMFSLERLLLSIAVDTRCSLDILKKILPGVQNIRDKETVDRDRLRQLGVAITERLPQSNKKRKKADTDGEYLCEVCKSNLYVSLVAETEDDEVYCLQHAAECISSNKITINNCKLMYSYTEEELGEIVDKVISTIDSKTHKKPTKSSN